MQHYTAPPANASAGLDLFAAAWLERFTAHGGSVVIEADGRAMYWQPLNDQSPDYEAPPEDWTDEQKRSRREIDRWMFLGRQRELEELLDLVPGGREAIKAHIRAFPTTEYANGVTLYR